MCGSAAWTLGKEAKESICFEHGVSYMSRCWWTGKSLTVRTLRSELQGNFHIFFTLKQFPCNSRITDSRKSGRDLWLSSSSTLFSKQSQLQSWFRAICSWVFSISKDSDIVTSFVFFPTRENNFNRGNGNVSSPHTHIGRFCFWRSLWITLCICETCTSSPTWCAQQWNAFKDVSPKLLSIKKSEEDLNWWR